MVSPTTGATEDWTGVPPNDGIHLLKETGPPVSTEGGDSMEHQWPKTKAAQVNQLSVYMTRDREKSG